MQMMKNFSVMLMERISIHKKDSTTSAPLPTPTVTLTGEAGGLEVQYDAVF